MEALLNFGHLFGKILCKAEIRSDVVAPHRLELWTQGSSSLCSTN